MFDTFVSFHARLNPRAPAMITAGRSISYAELDGDVDRFAAGLRARGVGPHSGVVSIQIEDAYLQHVLLLALARLGGCSSPIYDDRADLRLNDREWDAPVPLMLLTSDWIAATLKADPVSVETPPLPPEGLGRVLLSSGTTKAPRRVGHSWRMLEVNARSTAVTTGAGKAGIWIAPTGMDSIMGSNMALGAWACGAALVVGAHQASLPSWLEAVRPTLVGLTPVYLQQLLQDLPPGFTPQPHLRISVAGSALPAAVAREARLRLTHDVRVVYGATETGGTVMCDAAVLDTVPSAAGYPLPGVRVELVDPQGAPVARGEQGEVRVSSDRIAKAYLGDLEASAITFRDGFFHPGDLGRFLPDGLLVIDGRIDERMNLGGRKLLPNLVEEVALSCPGVVDAAAFAAPDDEGVEELWLAVVQGRGFERDRLAQVIAAHDPAFPALRFAWIEKIPRNPMGKIERAALRQATLATLGRGAPG